MFTLVIADDETRIRKGFSDIVDWGEMGYEVSGCYSDGAQVLEHLKRQPVDVVLTDISMPGVTGLEVARVLHEQYPGTICVLMSAYQEFDFARQAIAYDVEDYLLKPTRIADIQRVFTRIAKKLTQESETMARLEEEQQRLSEMDELIREQFLYDIYMRSMRDAQTVAQHTAYLYPNIREPALLVFIWRIEGEHDGQTDDMLRRALRGAREGAEYSAVTVERERFVVLSVCERSLAQAARGAIVSAIGETLTQLEGMTGLRFFQPYERFYETLSAFSTRNYRRPTGEGANALGEGENAYLMEQQRLLLGYLLSGSVSQAQTMLENILSYIGGLALPAQKGLLVDALVRMREKLLEMGAMKMDAPAYTPLIIAPTAQEAADFCREMLGKWQGLLGPRTGSACQEICDYVNLHYAQPISLDTVADQVFLSPVYVSRMFKQERGVNFSDYLLSVRMERAKQLLTGSGCKVYEVGKLVGYANPRYFYRVFKAYTGLTPSEYRGE